MEEKKFVRFKEEELGIREYIKNSLGKGRISDVLVEYTPVGEKIIVFTNRPGLVIGRKGDKIEELTSVIKRRFRLDNPHIEIRDITRASLDAQLVADSIALSLERKGSLKFKLIAYRMLKEIMDSGALGTEIVLSGKLPSERARTWRFFQGYIKKTGEPSKIVNKAMAQAKCPSGVVGIKVSILAPDAQIHDKIVIDDSLKKRVTQELPEDKKEAVKKSSKSKNKTRKK